MEVLILVKRSPDAYGLSTQVDLVDHRDKLLGFTFSVYNGETSLNANPLELEERCYTSMNRTDI